MHRLLAMFTVSLGVAALLGGTAMASDGAAADNKPESKTHVVASGDSLSSIAANEGMDSWRPLWDVNTEVGNPDLIYAGQALTVPTGPTNERPLPAGVVVEAAPVKVALAPQTSGSVQAANYAAGAPGLLARIRQRESGGNYAINTGNGFYGAYQFTLGTWQGVGGSGLPSNASAAEQDMRAQLLMDRRGCSPWPNTCF